MFDGFFNNAHFISLRVVEVIEPYDVFWNFYPAYQSRPTFLGCIHVLLLWCHKIASSKAIQMLTGQGTFVWDSADVCARFCRFIFGINCTMHRGPSRTPSLHSLDTVWGRGDSRYLLCALDICKDGRGGKRNSQHTINTSKNLLWCCLIKV